MPLPPRKRTFAASFPLISRLLRLALLFFVTFPHLSNWTIALCYPATWLTTSVLFVIYYKCFRWMPEMKQV